MKQIKTLTVGGETYRITDPDAARIDDETTRSDATWSSKNIVDKLAPAFTESGTVVTCEPVEGYPLEVVSHIELTQEIDDSGVTNLMDNYPDYKNPANWSVTSETPYGNRSFHFTLFTDGETMPSDYLCLSYNAEISGFVFEWDTTEEINYPELDGSGYYTINGYYEPEFGETIYNESPFCRIRYTGVTPHDTIPSDDELSVLETALAGLTLTLTEGSEPPAIGGPIIGYTEATLCHGGKNMFNIFAMTYPTVAADGSIRVTNRGVNSGIQLKDLAPGLRIGETYTLNAEVTHTGKFIYLLGYNNVWSFGSSLTMSQAILDSYVLWYNSVYDGDTTENIISNIQIELGSVATAYEPYRNEEMVTIFDRTVYGGRFNWQTGALTITHGCIDSYTSEEVPDGWVSSTGKLSEGAQVVYPLPETITVQLTPQEVIALPGVNTLYTNTGNIIVTGRADPIAAIADLNTRLAALEAALVNT